MTYNINYYRIISITTNSGHSHLGVLGSLGGLMLRVVQIARAALVIGCYCFIKFFLRHPHIIKAKAKLKSENFSIGNGLVAIFFMWSSKKRKEKKRKRKGEKEIR